MTNVSLQAIMATANTTETNIDPHYHNQQNYSWIDYKLAIAAVATTIVTASLTYVCAKCTTKYCSGTHDTSLEGEIV